MKNNPFVVLSEQKKQWLEVIKKHEGEKIYEISKRLIEEGQTDPFVVLNMAKKEAYPNHEEEMRRLSNYKLGEWELKC